jgi:hypothetical protein
VSSDLRTAKTLVSRYPYPSPQAAYTALHTDVSQSLLARFHNFASLHPDFTARQVFNVGDDLAGRQLDGQGRWKNTLGLVALPGPLIGPSGLAFLVAPTLPVDRIGDGVMPAKRVKSESLSCPWRFSFIPPPSSQLALYRNPPTAETMVLFSPGEGTGENHKIGASIQMQAK